MVAEHIHDLIKKKYPKYQVVIGELPSLNSNLIGVVMQDGNPNTEYFGSATVYEPIAKIVVRSTSHEEGDSMCNNIKEMLHKFTDQYFLSSYIVGTPMYLGKDAQQNYEFQITFRIQVKE